MSDVTKSSLDLFGMYLDEIGRYPLLTKEDEARLGKLVMEGQEAKKRLKSGERLSIKEKRSLRKAIEDGEQAAREFTCCNLRLVVSVAQKFQWSSLPISDLVQAGNIGLAHAVEKFDWRKGFKFSTYATWWIRQAIGRAIEMTSRTIRLPSHITDEARFIKRIESELEAELGHLPSFEEIAEELGTTPEHVSEILQFERDPTSLDIEVTEDGDMTLEDIVADARSTAALEAIEHNMELEQLMAVLTPLERKVIVMRYGLHDMNEAMNRINVSKSLKLSEDKIRLLERRAMTKLRAEAQRLRMMPTAV